MDSINNNLNIDKIWQDVLSIIKDNIEIESYNTWFLPIKPISFEQNVFLIEVPSQFFYEYIEEHFVDILVKSLKKVVAANIQLEYNILVDKYQEKLLRYPTAKQPSETSHSNSIPYTGLSEKAGAIDHAINPFAIPGIKLGQIHPQLNPNYTFDNFIEGSCNRIARSAGLQIVERLGKTPFNPLIVYSGSGLGKTHLVNAIGNEAKRAYPSLNVLYVSSEKFINQFISYSKNQHVTDFINFYQQIDMLIVDDAQGFSKAEKTQEAFFTIFNHLHQSGKQIILTLDRAPKDLQGLQDRLLSRFRWGLTTDLEIPDYETRALILKQKMKRDGIDFSEEIVSYIAAHIKNNIRELEGTIISLLAQSSFNKKEINMEMVAKVVKSHVKQNVFIHTIPGIQEVVSESYKLTIEDLKSKTRKREMVEARHLSMYLIKRYTKNSLKTIGECFGGRDHTTVIHACQSVENLLATDDQFKQKVEMLRNKLETNKT